MIPANLSFMLEDLGPAIKNHLWQSTIFALAILLLTVTLRKNQARIRYWLWLAASVKFLVPFSLLISLGSLLTTRHNPSPVPTVLYDAMEQVGQPFTQPSMRQVAPLTFPATPPEPHHLIPIVLTSVWIIGFVVVLSLWWVYWRRVSAAIRTGVFPTGGRELRALRRLEHVGAIGAPIQLLLSQSTLAPGIHGFTRPILMWPEGISAHIDDAHLESILLHELCHVRRRDNLTAAIHMFVEAAFWFHPLVWWLGSQLEQERERACDEDVLALTAQPQIYAESILKVCEFCIELPLACVSGVTGADLKQRITQIMTDHVVHKLDLKRKLLLTAAALTAVAVSAGAVMAGVRPMLPVLAQILHATGPLPSYEVATIKPEAGPHIPGNLAKDIRRFTGTTKDLIEGAYNIPYGAGNRIVGGPGWISSDRYVIEGKVPADLMVRMQTMEGPESRTQNALMKQSLLADRFKLKAHFEMRELPVYELVVAKGKAKVKAADPNASLAPLYFPSPGGTKPADASAPPVFAYANTFGPNHRLIVTGDGHGGLVMTTRGVAMDNVAQSLEEVVDDLGGRTIVNKTGLKGQYDFTLNWTTQQAAAAPTADNDAPASNAPSIFTALEEQLGLKLVPAKGMVEVIVIDSIEKPSAN